MLEARLGEPVRGLWTVLMVVVAVFFTATTIHAQPFAYISNFGSDDLSVIDISTSPGTVVATVTVGMEPVGVAVSPGGTLVFVANGADNSLSIVDAQANPPVVIATVAVGLSPSGVTVSPDGATVFVSNFDDGSVSVIDVATALGASPDLGIQTIAVGGLPDGMVVTEDGSRLYVLDAEDESGSDPSRVVVVDLTVDPPAILTSIDVPKEPHGAALANGRVFVACSNNDEMAVIDTATNTVIDTLAIPDGAYAIAAHPDGSTAYVAGFSSASVSVVDVSTVPFTIVDSLTVPSAVTFGLSLDPEGERLYASNGLSDSVSVFDITSKPGTSLGEVTVGTQPIAFGQFIGGAVFLFADGFESGDTTAWN